MLFDFVHQLVRSYPSLYLPGLFTCSMEHF
jgi:hypothetical protein